MFRVIEASTHIAKVVEPSMCLPKAVEPSMFCRELHSNRTLPLSNCRSNPIFCSGICFVMTLDLGCIITSEADGVLGSVSNLFSLCLTA